MRVSEYDVPPPGCALTVVIEVDRGVDGAHVAPGIIGRRQLRNQITLERARVPGAVEPVRAAQVAGVLADIDFAHVARVNQAADLLQKTLRVSDEDIGARVRGVHEVTRCIPAKAVNMAFTEPHCDVVADKIADLGAAGIGARTHGVQHQPLVGL